MNYTWQHFYMEFADKLLSYKNNRKELITKIKDVFDKSNLRLPTLSNGDLNDIDPFTIFALFNKGLKLENRIKLVTNIKEVFEVESDIPSEFDGIPVVNNQMGAFYAFEGDPRRKPNDIDNLWTLLEVALKLSENDTLENRTEFCNIYDIVHDQFGIKWNITIALFWIRSNYFINLDSRNIWYMKIPEVMPTEFVEKHKRWFKNNAPYGKEYLSIRDDVVDFINNKSNSFKSLVELSDMAFKESERVNLSLKEKVEDGDSDSNNDNTDRVRYWLYSPGHNASKWDEFHEKEIMAIGWKDFGDLSVYRDKTEIRVKFNTLRNDTSSHKNDVCAIWDFCNEIKPGDVIFVKRGVNDIIGRGVVESDYNYDSNDEVEYPNFRKVKWTNSGKWEHPGGKAVTKTLTEITQYVDYVEKLKNLFIDEDTDDDTPVTSYTKYDKEDFLSEVFMTENQYDLIKSVLLNDKNIILEGAPGVGKTYVAKRLAYSIMGEKDTNRVMMVQFHQSYSYEDFIMGYKPIENGSFELQRGPFYNFCSTAKEDSENNYFFIIDEINRGNLSKIFGELFMLIESDKRGTELLLTYKNEKFSVPANVHIIGMMNTADRSLAIIDYALRRRFSFIRLNPQFDSEGFKQYQNSLDSDELNRLVNCINELNYVITNDDSLGDGFCIGHSYLTGLTKEKLSHGRLNEIVEYKLIPLLKEYWFDEPNKLAEWSSKLRGSIK